MINKKSLNEPSPDSTSNKSTILEEIKRPLSENKKEEEEVDSSYKDSESSSKDTKETPKKEIIDLSKVTKTLKSEHSLYKGQATILEYYS